MAALPVDVAAECSRAMEGDLGRPSAYAVGGTGYVARYKALLAFIGWRGLLERNTPPPGKHRGNRHMTFSSRSGSAMKARTVEPSTMAATSSGELS